MPELPEVESTRRHLTGSVVGKRIIAAEVRRDRMVRRNERPADVVSRLVGARVDSLGRWGKFIIGKLSNDVSWIIHLGMSGRLQIASPGEHEVAHTNVVVRFADDLELRFVDPRTFGFMAAFTDEELAASTLALLGRDALDDLPPSRRLADALATRTAPIKMLLLDQRLIAGLGNIYADEVLFRARIAPQRRGDSLTSDEVKALRAAIRPVLEAGLRAGGTSLDDLAYLLPDGRAGEYMSRLRVYGRTDEPCHRCGTPVRSQMLRGRSTHWCPSCQS